MQQKKYKLVIGGSGFVGTYLINKLDLDSTLNFDKNPSLFFNHITTIGNILDKSGLDVILKDVDSIILLAAEHRDDVSPKSLYYEVNVNGTKNVLDLMDKYAIKKLIFTSSVAIYGLDKLNPDENHTEDPFNHYGKSKWKAEQVIKQWYENEAVGKSVTIIRPTVIFGERNRGNVYNLLKQIKSGNFFMIGNGQNIKSMAYVGNVVALIKNRLEKTDAGFHVFNYADKPDFTTSDLVSFIDKKMKLNISKIKIPFWLGMIIGYCFDIISKIFRKKLTISSVRVKKFCSTTQFDATKAHSSFEAPFTLKQGLDLTLDHEFINPKEDDILFYSE
jgi:GlcNAc-P-P-Und epimerase